MGDKFERKGYEFDVRKGEASNGQRDSTHGEMRESKLEDKFEDDGMDKNSEDSFTVHDKQQEEKTKDKFRGNDIAKINVAVQETLDWVGRHKLADKFEIEAKLKEMEGYVNQRVDEMTVTVATSEIPAKEYTDSMEKRLNDNINPKLDQMLEVMMTMTTTKMEGRTT